MADRGTLERVRRARARRDKADREWDAAIRAAAEQNSLREVGEAAGISHVSVLQRVQRADRADG